MSLVWLNYDSQCPRGGYLERPFTVPAGVTQIKLELDEVVRGPGGATGDFSLSLYDSTGITIISTTAFTPSASATDVSTASITVTPGVEYRVRIVCDAAGTQSTFVCGAFRVRPVTSSDTFWTNSFQRIDINNGLLWDSNEVDNDQQNPRFRPQSEMSHIEFNTTSTNVRVEVFCNDQDIAGATLAKISVFADGVSLTALASPTDGAISYLSISVPNGPRKLSIYGGPHVVRAYAASTTEHRGSFLAAVYLPWSAPLVIAYPPAQANETIVIYGDSKLSGLSSTLPASNGFMQSMRSRGARIIIEGAGGNCLSYDVGTTLTVAACTSFARKLCRSNPTQIIVGIGRNDFVGATFSAANLVTQIGNLLDAIHAQGPNIAVKIALWSHETTETAVSGTAWDTERTAITALATSRSAWCAVIDMARMWTGTAAGTYTADGVHPNDAGADRIDRILSAEIRYPFNYCELPSLICRWDCDNGLVAGSMGAVSSIGTSPPIVTLSGTAAIAARLLIQIDGAGARGTATFRWSIDGGRSWIERGVLTAATVTLVPFGVTASFATGTNYSLDNLYTADAIIASTLDQATNTYPMTATGSPRIAVNALNGRPSLNQVIGGNNGLASATLTGGGAAGAPPYSFWVVGKMVNLANPLAFIGRSAAGTGGALYHNAPDTITFHTGTQVTAVNCTTLTSDHIFIGTAHTAGNNHLYIDGVDNSFTAGGAIQTGVCVGMDLLLGWYNDGAIYEFGWSTAQFTTDQVKSLTAKLGHKYSIPVTI